MRPSGALAASLLVCGTVLTTGHAPRMRLVGARSPFHHPFGKPFPHYGLRSLAEVQAARDEETKAALIELGCVRKLRLNPPPAPRSQSTVPVRDLDVSQQELGFVGSCAILGRPPAKTINVPLKEKKAVPITAHFPDFGDAAERVLYTPPPARDAGFSVSQVRSKKLLSNPSGFS